MAVAAGAGLWQMLGRAVRGIGGGLASLSGRAGLVQALPRVDQLVKEAFGDVSIHEMARRFGKEEAFQPLAVRVPDDVAAAAYFRHLQRLGKTNVGKVSDRLFAHIFADHIVSGSSLEGSDSGTMLDFRLEVLDAVVKAFGTDVVCQNGELDSICQTWLRADPSGKDLAADISAFERLRGETRRARELHRLFSSNDVEGLRSRLTKDLAALDKGEELFFPGGWYKHAVDYGFRRDPDGTYSFRVYNLGSGSQYHTLALAGYKTMRLPFAEVTETTIERLVARPFLTSLIDLEHVDFSEQWIYSQQLYGNVLDLLQGQPSARRYLLEELREPQHGGTCTYASLSAAFSQQLKDQWRPRRLDFETEFMAFSAYFEQNKERMAQEETPWRLMNFGVEEFSRRVKGYHSNGILNDAEYAHVGALIESVREGYWAQSCQYQVSQLAQPKGPDLALAHFPAAAAAVAPGWTPPRGQASAVAMNWPQTSLLPATPETFVQDAKTLHTTLSEELKEGFMTRARRDIADYAGRLPLEPSRWQSMSAGEATEALQEIRRLSEHHLASVGKAERGLDGTSVLAQASLLIVAEILLNIADPSAGDSVAPLMSSKVRALLTQDASRLRLNDPVLEVRLQEIRNYLTRYEGTESFFGFEKWPRKKVSKEGEFPCIVPDEMPCGEAGEDVPKEFVNSWPYMRWIQDRLQRDDVKEKLLAVSPELADLSPTQLVLPILTRNPDLDLKHTTQSIINRAWRESSDLIVDLLPPTFQVASDIAYLTDYFFEGDGKHPLELPGSSYARHEVSIAYRSRRLTRHLGKGDEAYLARSDENLWPFNRRYSFESDIDGRRQFERLSALQILRDNGEQLARELQSLPSVRSLQIQETLAHFVARPFNSVDDFKEFSSLMFEPRLLEKEFARNPADAAHLARQLSAFCRSNITSSLNNDSLVTAALYLEINGRLNAYVTHFLKTHPEWFPQDFQPDFLGTREVVRTQLARAHLDETVKNFLCRSLVLSYEGEEITNTQQAAELIAAYVGYQTSVYQKVQDPDHAGKDIEFDPERDLQVERVYWKHRDVLLGLLEGPNRDAILNSILPAVGIAREATTWKPYTEFPRYRSEDGRVVIDILQGTVFDGGGALRRLPRDILGRQLFVKLTGVGEEVRATEVDEDVYQFVGRDGKPWRVASGRFFFRVSRFINGRWYHHHEVGQLGVSATTTKIGRGNTLWFSPDPDEVLVLDEVSDLPKYRGEVTWASGGGQQPRLLSSIRKLDGEGNDTGLVLANLPDTVLNQTFQDAEDPSWVLPWSRGGRLETVEFPRLSLTFDVQGSDPPSLRCREREGYRLAERQRTPELFDDSHYLVMEKEVAGRGWQQEVLIPRWSLKEWQGSSMTPAMTPDRDGAATSLMTYLVNADSQVLEPKTTEARFYLAMVHLYKHNYYRAMELLRGYGAQQRPLSPEERQILTWIADLGSKNHDSNPHAYAVRLKAQHLLYRDRDDFHGPRPDGNKLSDAYSVYLESVDGQWGGRLLPFEEKRIADQVEFMNELACRRQKELPRHPFWDTNCSLPPSSTTAKPIPSQGVDVGVQPLPIPIDSVFPDATGCVAGTSPGLMSGSLLKPVLCKNFIDYYRLVRGDFDAQPTQLGRYVSMMTGYKYPSGVAVEAVKADIADFLIVMSRSPRRSESPLATLLLGALLAPDKFPSSVELERQIADHKMVGGREDPLLALAIEVRDDFLSRRIGSPEASVDARKPIPDPRLKKRERVSSSATPVVFPAIAPAFRMDTPEINASDLLARMPAAAEPYTSKPMTFSGEVADSFVRSRLEAIEEASIQFRQAHPSGPLIRVKDEERLFQMRDDLKTKVQLEEGFLANLENDILSLADRLPQEPVARANAVTARATGTQTALTMIDIAQLFLRRDSAGLVERNPALTETDMKPLVEDMTSYLVRSVRMKHLKNILDSLNAVLERPAGQRSVDQNQLAGLWALMNAKRAYRIEDHPEYLVVEWVLGILLRPDQVANLDRVRMKAGRVESPHELGNALEAIMGSGKTSVLIPLLQLFNADGNHLAVVVMPEALVPSMSEELQRRSGSTFGQGVQVIEIGREHFKTMNATGIEDRLVEARDQRQVVLISGRSVHNLYLNFIDMLMEGQKGEDIWCRLITLKNIFRLLRVSGVGTIDEVDSVMNVLMSNHFTGAESLPLPNTVIDAVTDLFLVLSDPEVSQGVSLGFLGNGGAPLTAETETILKERVIAAALAGTIGKDDRDVVTFFQALSSTDSALVAEYLRGKDDLKALAFVAELPSSKIQDFLAVLKEEISVLLPLTLKKNLGEHYGPVPAFEDGQYFAIPYHQGAPVLGSQFGTDLETFNYTVQMMLEKGIPQQIVEAEIRALQELHRRWQSFGGEKGEMGSEAVQQFKKWSGDPSLSLMHVTPQDCAAITTHINGDRVLQMELIRRHVVTQMRVYPVQTESTAETFSVLFKSLIGLSGTLWNQESFPKVFKDVYASDTVERTVDVLWRTSPHEVGVLGEEQTKDAKSAVASLFGGTGVPTGSIIDSGGVLRHFSREEVARQMLVAHDDKSPIKGVVFYDVDGSLRILEKGRNNSIPLKQSGLRNDQRIVLWDQEHTTGSDIAVGNQTAAMTVSRHTLLRDIMQAAWRLRRLGGGQNVRLLVPAADGEVIRATIAQVFHEDIRGPITLAHVLLYAAYNQAVRQGEDNFRALPHKMLAVVLDKVMKVLLTSTMDLQATLALFRDVIGLFVQRVDQRPYELYGRRAARATRKDEVVMAEVDRFLSGPVMTALRSERWRQLFDTDEISEEVRRLAQSELAHMPDTIMTAASQYETERTMEVQKQTEKNTELRVEKVDTSVRSEGESLEDFEELGWNPDLLYSSSAFAPISYDATLAKGGTYDVQGFERALKAQHPVAEANDIFETSAVGLLGCKKAHFFAPALLSSLNLTPLHYQGVKPFHRGQRSLDNLLVVQDKTTGGIRVVMLAQGDVAKIQDLLFQGKSPPESECRVGIYNVWTGLIRQGKESIDEMALENNALFQRLKVQAKFFNGEVVYSEVERPYLKAWLHDCLTSLEQKDNVFEFFFHHVLTWKDHNTAIFLGSSLHKVLIDLAEEFHLDLRQYIKR